MNEYLDQIDINQTDLRSCNIRPKIKKYFLGVFTKLPIDLRVLQMA
jgi:hypothetical protein